METHVPTESPQPAGFWLRVWAKLADVLVLNAIAVVMLCGVSILYVIGARLPWIWIGFIGPLVLWAAYLAIYTSGGRQTLGYRLAGTKVTTCDGQDVSFGRAALRSLLNTAAYCLIGYLVGLVDYVAAGVRSKRALHDFATGTCVILAARPQVRSLWVAGVASFVVPIVLVFGVMRPFFLQMYYIPSEAMTPTFAVGDHLMVNKLSYRLGEPEHGDLVVFRSPPQTTTDGRERDFIKRVVGLPGDVLEVRVDGHLYRNGKRLPEPYLAEQRIRYVMAPTVVPKGQLFVMGDNRNNSNDSHAWGAFDRGRLKGKAMAVLPRDWFPASSPGHRVRE